MNPNFLCIVPEKDSGGPTQAQRPAQVSLEIDLEVVESRLGDLQLIHICTSFPFLIKILLSCNSMLYMLVIKSKFESGSSMLLRNGTLHNGKLQNGTLHNHTLHNVMLHNGMLQNDSYYQTIRCTKQYITKWYSYKTVCVTKR